MRTGPAALVLTCAAIASPAPAASLAPCPPSPNCVSTDAADAGHAIAPIPFDGTPAAAHEHLRRALATVPRLRIVADDGRRIRAEVRSRIFRFVDDVDLEIDPEARLIRMRSASRVGYSDLGANRRRLERIRAAWRSTPAGDTPPTPTPRR